MTVNIARLRKLSAAAKDSVYGSRVADEYVAALCHAAPEILDELERLRRFRDAVLDHDEDCGDCELCINEDGGIHEDYATERIHREHERAAIRALAKESGNG